jgi:prepilin-type processing-associated H-X9-DG protein
MSNGDRKQKGKSPSASDKINQWQPRLSFGEWLLFFSIMGGLGLAIFPWHNHGGREKARQVACMSNLKQQSAAFLIYNEDNDAKFPPSDHWMEVILPYGIRKESNETNPPFAVFRCPSMPSLKQGAFNYAMHDKLSGVLQHKIAAPEKASLLFESSTTQKNAHNNGISFATPHGAYNEQSGKSKKYGSVAFADGHVKMQPALER